MLSRLLGPCSISPEDGTIILLSLINGQVDCRTSYRDTRDYDEIFNCICQWLARGTYAAGTLIKIVDQFLSKKNARRHAYLTRALCPHIMHIVQEFVLCATQDLSVNNLLLCSHFILKVQGTFLWDVGNSKTMRVVMKFLDLLDANKDTVSRMHLKDSLEYRNLCKAFTYVYRWTLHRASGVNPPWQELVRLNCFRREFCGFNLTAALCTKY